MKLAVRVKLLPTPEQASALEATLHACNDAANWLSSEAFTHQVTSRAGLQARAYADLRARGLSAQPALHVVRKVADGYAAVKAQARVTSKPITFRPGAAQPFDDRCLSWQVDATTVSIWTVNGRLKNIAFTGHPQQMGLLARYRRGESDLSCHNGQWYLTATCEVPEADENKSPDGFIGVDLGIVNIATTSTGRRHSGRSLNRCRERDLKLRRKLQRKGTKSAKRRAKRRAGREARRARDINHKISKCIVAEAGGTSRALKAVGEHRLWDRSGRPGRHPRAGTAQEAPARQVAFLGVPSARAVHRLQGQARRGAGRTRRPRPHQSAMLPVPSRRPA